MHSSTDSPGIIHSFMHSKKEKAIHKRHQIGFVPSKRNPADRKPQALPRSEESESTTQGLLPVERRGKKAVLSPWSRTRTSNRSRNKLFPLVSFRFGGNRRWEERREGKEGEEKNSR